MKELIRNRKFLLVWLAQAASGLGGIFAMFIEAWLVYTITGSKMAMSGLVMAFMTASLTVQLGVGPFLDRWDRRFVMALSRGPGLWDIFFPPRCTYWIPCPCGICTWRS